MRAVLRWLRSLLPGAQPPAAATEPIWIEPPDLAARLQRPSPPTIVDVRGPDEFTGELGHIDGAINIPLADLPSRLGDLSVDHGVVLVCKTQVRSARAADVMRASGFRDVAVLRGGMVAWAQQRG
jgi:rhodanese-related sulfurtransferase